MILAWLAAAFISALVLGANLTLTSVFLVPLAILLTVAAFGYRGTRWKLVLLIAAATCLGLARSPRPPSAPSSTDLAFYNGHSVSMQGRVSAEPDIRDKGIIYQVSVDSIAYGGGPKKVAGKVELHTPRSQLLEYGDQISLQGRLIEPKNSAALPYKDILARRGIGSEMSFPRVIDLGPSRTGWLGWIVPLRQHMENGIDRWLPEPEAALLIAITLGAHSASLGNLTNVLIATGLIHIIAISGIKVAMVAGTLLALIRPFSRRLLALLVPLPALWLYVLVTGATAAGERSALMWTVVFVAAYLGRETVPLVSLAFVVALMIAINPDLPWDIGFQMTVFGTLAIIVHSPSLIHRCAYVPSPFREALAVTVAAQIGTLPIVIVGFHVVSTISAIANALVLPLLPLLIALGFILGVGGGVVQLAAPISALAYVLLHAVVAASNGLAKLHGAYPAPAISMPIALLYYALLGSISWRVIRKTGFAPLRQYRPRVRDVVGAIVLGASLLTISAFAGVDQGNKLYTLGTGEAKVVQSEGRIALIDGSSTPFTLLERLGSVLGHNRRLIDVVVVTNPSAANMTGLNEVLNHYGVSEVVDVGSEHPSATYSRWRANLRSRKIPTYLLRTNGSFKLGSVRISSLGPDALCSVPNDCAGLLRVSTVKRSLLLIGSASDREQLEAVFRPVRLHSDTLVTDSTKPVVPVFLRAVNPHLLLQSSSVPSSSRHGRLKPGVLQSWIL